MRKSPTIETKAIAVIALGLALRLAFAAANTFWLDLPHQDDFHAVASALAAADGTPRSGIAWIYARLLGVVYLITGPHEIVGFTASALAWTAAALLFDSTMRVLGAAPPARLTALTLFALTPSSIFFGAVIMRDVYQLLFVNLLALSVLRIGMAREYDSAVPMVLSGVALCLLHRGFMVWTPLVMLALLGWVLVQHRPRIAVHALVALLVLAYTVFAAAMYHRFGYDLSDGLNEASDLYLSNLRSGDIRTEFRFLSELSAAGGAVAIVVGLLQYMLEPMPWDVEGLGDLGVLAENVLRLILIGMAVWAFVTDRARRIPLALMLLAYCCLEGIWSLGTIAWGTAIRHHLPASGILIAAAFASYRFERTGSARS